MSEQTAGMPSAEVPPLCESHQIELVQRLHLSPADPWRAAMLICQVLMFRYTIELPSIVSRCGGDFEMVSLVLAELGCPACDNYQLFRRAIRVLFKGLDWAARVSHGNATDDDFPMPEEER